MRPRVDVPAGSRAGTQGCSHMMPSATGNVDRTGKKANERRARGQGAQEGPGRLEDARMCTQRGGWVRCVQTASTAPPGRSHGMKEPKANVEPSADVVRITSRPGPLSFTPRTFSPCPSSTASTLFSLIRCPHGCHLCPHALRPASNPFLRVSHLPALLHNGSHPVRVWPVRGDCCQDTQ